jgi:hypothetical protein
MGIRPSFVSGSFLVPPGQIWIIENCMKVAT